MEQLAIRYLNYLDTAPEMGTVILFTILGIASFVAISTTNFKFTIRRAPYFFVEALIFLILASTNLLIYTVPQAISNDYLWVVLSSLFATWAIGGYIRGIFASARSLDGYGDRWHWFYSLIPFVNLALLFMSSRQPAERTGAMRRTIGAVILVSLAFVLYRLGFEISDTVKRDTPSIKQSMQNNDEIAGKFLDASFQSEGVAAVLQSTVRELKVPMQVDHFTTLTSMEAVGSTLHYGYTLAGNLMPLTEERKSKIAKNLCNDPDLKQFIKAGATIRATYTDDTNHNLGEANANTDICQKFQ